VAAGSREKKLGVPGEEKFDGKGVIHCALCDGGHFADRVVAVCGGGDAGITEALYLSKIASRVTLIEAQPCLTGCAILKERMADNPKLEVRCATRVVEMKGADRMEAMEIVNVETGLKETLRVDGVLVHVGIEPNTGYLEGVVPLDDWGQVIVDARMQTEVPTIIAAGDVRSNSPCQVAAAVGDGATAAITAQKVLQEMAGQR